MTISGEMTRLQQLSIRLMAGLMGLIFGAGLLGFFVMQTLLLDQHHWRPPDKGTQIAALAFCLTMGALAFVLMRWLNADTVVAFACDDCSFRFRKVGREQPETRSLSEIVKVSGGVGRAGLVYRVVFQDGAQAALWCDDLPNAKVFAEWLRSRSHGG